MENGFVYFGYHEANNLVKIGKTTRHPFDREKEHGAKMLYWHKSNRINYHELVYLRYFDLYKCKNGGKEWFSIPRDSMYEFIENQFSKLDYNDFYLDPKECESRFQFCDWETMHKIYKINAMIDIKSEIKEAYAKIKIFELKEIKCLLSIPNQNFIYTQKAHNILEYEAKINLERKLKRELNFQCLRVCR